MKQRKRTIRRRNQKTSLSNRDKALILKLGNEVKVFDTVQSTASISTSGTRYGLTNIAVGTGVSNRIGRSVKLKDVLLRYTVVLPASASYATQDTHNRMRIILFQWLDKGSPAVTDVLQSSSVLSPINIDNFRDVRVFRDEIIDLHLWSSYDDGTNHQLIPDQQSRKWYYKCKEDCNIEFNAAGTVEHGGINLLVISDSALVTHPTIEFYSRLKYYD